MVDKVALGAIVPFIDDYNMGSLSLTRDEVKGD